MRLIDLKKIIRTTLNESEAIKETEALIDPAPKELNDDSEPEVLEEEPGDWAPNKKQFEKAKSTSK